MTLKLSEVMRRLRRERGMTQNELADGLEAVWGTPPNPPVLTYMTFRSTLEPLDFDQPAFEALTANPALAPRYEACRSVFKKLNRPLHYCPVHLTSLERAGCCTCVYTFATAPFSVKVLFFRKNFRKPLAESLKIRYNNHRSILHTTERKIHMIIESLRDS